MSCGVYLKYFSLIRVNFVKVKNIKNHGTQEVYPEIRRYVKWRALLLKVVNYCCKALHCSYLIYGGRGYTSVTLAVIISVRGRKLVAWKVNIFPMLSKFNFVLLH